LPITVKIMIKHPSNVFGSCIPHLVAREYPEMAKPGLLYLDTWPIGPIMLAVFHPDMMAQFCQERSLPKDDWQITEFQPFTHAKDLVNMEGAERKRWRAIFNPGFSTRNLMSLVPAVLEEAGVFIDLLKGFARSGEIIEFDKYATKMGMDITGRMVL
jgi:cytochrome P450